MFKSTQNKGFSMTFENSLTISVQFGSGNYCSAQNYGAEHGAERKEPIHESGTAEIAIWNEANEWFNFGSDTVAGWQTPNEVAEWISRVAKATDITNV